MVTPVGIRVNKITPLYLLGEPACLLMVTNTHPPLSLVCQQLAYPLLYPSYPFTPHSSNFIIYIDNINNSRSSSSGTLPLVLSSSSSNASIPALEQCDGVIQVDLLGGGGQLLVLVPG
jgi:hypothetical protein